MNPLAPHRVVVTVGTDHHPFDRLIHWVDAWLAGRLHLREAVECVVQHGSSRPSSRGRAVSRLPRDELLGLMAGSDVVIGHAGPGTIADCRSQGKLPVVVPRLARLGEVVDDHQVAFARRLATQGLVRLATEERGLHELLDEALADPASLHAPRPPDPARAAALRLDSELRKLVAARPPRKGRLPD